MLKIFLRDDGPGTHEFYCFVLARKGPLPLGSLTLVGRPHKGGGHGMLHVAWRGLGVPCEARRVSRMSRNGCSRLTAP
eukprot:s2105_g12.t1